MDMPFDPWHLWGTTATVVSNQRGAISQQLARVNYARPESWSFFFGARILTLDNTTALNPVSIAVQWDVMLGVGRSSFSTPNLLGPSALATPRTYQPFAFFAWRAIPENTLVGDILNNPRYTTQTRTQPLDDADATSFQTIDSFCAQDIQVSAVVTQSSNIVVQCTLELTAYLAPRVHVRPEWFEEKFRGSENQGS